MQYKIVPCPKPRMSQRDKWAKRPAVMRYRAFCDRARLLKMKLPDHGAHVTFVLPMPKSWSEKKKAENDGQPHQVKPDTSNLLKALEDAIHKEDSHIWNYAGLTKVWGYSGQIIIEPEAPTA